MIMVYAHVALPVPLNQLFIYEVPSELEERLQEGCRVYVPFGSRRMTGYTVEILSHSEREDVKPIIEVLDDVPALSRELLSLTRWVADYYFAPWGEVIRAALPSASQLKGTSFLVITPAGKEALADESLEEGARQALGRLVSRKRLRKNTLAKGLKPLVGDDGGLETVGSPKATPPQRQRQQSADSRRDAYASRILSLLIERGWAEVEWSMPSRSSDSCFQVGGNSFFSPTANPFTLTPDQALACQEIQGALFSEKFQTYLLHGVTGSGKTEVYLQAMAQVLSLGKGALLLVPEIVLASLLLSRIEERFGKRVAVLHSGLTPGQKMIQWNQIRQGKAAIAVGARSAVFAPFENLGLIVIDEEHDPSYKQEESPRYHARDVAVMRGKLADVVVILGSATPSLESTFNAGAGKFKRLVLSRRVEERTLPKVEIVDMRKGKGDRGKRPIFSPRLWEAMAERIARGEQTLLFLNRRGFSSFVQCLDCGFVFSCPNCDLSFTYHRAERRLMCHHCNERTELAEICPQCRGSRLFPFGLGTQQVEEEARRNFPQARIARLDRDVARRVAAVSEVLQGLRDGKIDILIGTQMIAKGHDFPRITLVGVISADASLNLPDFRAGEHTFQLLTQVAGRAGRGDVPGEVIVQTYNPSNYTIVNAQGHDYESFYAQELSFRQRLHYPPWMRVISICIESVNETKGEKAAARLGELLQENANLSHGLRVLGPSRAVLSRLKNRYRWRLWLQNADSLRLRSLLKQVLERYYRSSPSLKSIKVHIDVDPFDLL